MFKASNGASVEVAPSAGVIVRYSWMGESRMQLPGVEALREFFQHERDTELGRWRSKKHPDVVCYPRYSEGEEERFLLCVNEATGLTDAPYERALAHESYLAREVADEYFAAHPEPKPWHDAKPGEVWAVKTKHNDQERPVFVNSDGDFENAEEYFHPEFRDITAGRRIWPEVSDG